MGDFLASLLVGAVIFDGVTNIARIVSVERHLRATRKIADRETANLLDARREIMAAIEKAARGNDNDNG